MGILASFLAGFIISGGYNKLETYLVQDYEEISTLYNWPFYMGSFIVGGLCALAYSLYGLRLETFMIMSLMVVLTFLSLFDLKYMLLPTKIIYPGFILGVLYQLGQSILHRDYYFIINGLLGAMVGYGLFCLLFYGSKYFLKREGLGYGDVRLMGLIGMYIGIESLAIMLIISSVLALLVGIVLIMKKGKSEAFPFGPYLCIGAVIMSLFENQMITWYLKWIGA